MFLFISFNINLVILHDCEHEVYKEKNWGETLYTYMHATQ